jgi:general secretion pathway protein D
VLGNIPILGWLFKNTSEQTTKTNLYIFITPRVIENPGEAESVLQEKQGQMDSIRGGSFKINQRQPAETQDE